MLLPSKMKPKSQPSLTTDTRMFPAAVWPIHVEVAVCWEEINRYTTPAIYLKQHDSSTALHKRSHIMVPDPGIS